MTELTSHHCTCAVPLPVEKGERKGAARTVCSRCGLPVPLTFALTPPRS